LTPSQNDQITLIKLAENIVKNNNLSKIQGKIEVVSSRVPKCLVVDEWGTDEDGNKIATKRHLEDVSPVASIVSFVGSKDMKYGNYTFIGLPK
jgi:stage III sporulation protein SpoIIIAA